MLWVGVDLDTVLDQRAVEQVDAQSEAHRRAVWASTRKRSRSSPWAIAAL
ncbi:hypothetical protein FHR38_000882 [Micromonospora polyrhachis]|uniref:Uncharacterized protein n=1 Tax=Micromonospora polyrhachis TaxID=1282883 RepID=A0A7W7SLS9_9ACTN|nr:hypothetical protein [Micromonospora polyrhachis]